MPELPEVETVVRQIRPHILGKKIAAIHIHPGGERLILPFTKEKLQARVLGQAITEVTRHGKYMRFLLDGIGEIQAHLRMTGRFLVSNAPIEHEHLRLSVEFSDLSRLNFIDIRKFATFIYEPRSRLGQKLGPDALEASSHLEAIYQQLRKRSKPIYSVLMDQNIIAGIGNIYANEILFASKIHPLTPANQISKSRLAGILDETERILAAAIDYKGTTLVDKTYKDVFEDYGEFTLHLQVYGRAGKPCNRCQIVIEKMRIGGRSVYFCPNCQLVRTIPSPASNKPVL